MERRNFADFEHYEQLAQHEHIIEGSKNPQNKDEFAEYKSAVLERIEPSLPPFENPHVQIKEPYTELGDYLDGDDFTNLLSVLGQFAGKTGSGLLSFGEAILN